jgi:circadian clock protein KaiC
LKQFFVGRNCTVVLLDDRTAAGSDLQLQSICHGVLLLQKISAEFGKPRRKISVSKMRGVDFRDGNHDISILQGGIVVYPRLVAAEHRSPNPQSTVSSGLKEFDELLGGGLDRGTSALILGPAGTGKSSLASLFAYTTAQRGERTAFYIFEESLNTFLKRSAGMGMPLDEFLKEGLITVQQVDPAELSPGEFASLVRQSVDRDGAQMIVIDSLNGYLNAMPSDQLLLMQMHELLTYLGQRHVLTIMCVAQQGLMGQMQSPVDLSYLADSVILLRFFEFAGAIKQAVSVLKKRSGLHERTIRELQLISTGPVVSAVLKDFHGIFTGVPRLEPLSETTRTRPFGAERK